jgi:phenylacetate-CoA ligase
LGLIAFQNPKGEWEVNSKTLLVEILDDQNQTVPLGEEGNVVITSLYNKAHPFIRYKIGDIGILDPKSTTAKPFLQKLIGRTNDFADLPSGKRVPGLTFYYVTKTIIEDQGVVKEFKVLQKTKSNFEVQYAANRVLNTEEKKAIERAMATYLEPGLKIDFAKLPTLERSKSGKLKQFTSLLY